MSGAIAALDGTGTPSPSTSRAWMIARLLRRLGVGVIAGVVGGVVSGLASRGAMRVGLLLMEEPGRRFTSNGTRVGEFTLGGTAFLVIGIGLVSGVVAGVTYAVARDWLAPLGRWRGLAFGGVLLAAYGRFVFDHHEFDFTVFGPAVVNVPLYAALFVICGLVAAGLADQLDPRVPELPVRRPLGLLRTGALVIVLGAGLLALIPIGALTFGTVRGTFFDPRDLGFAYAVTVFVAIVWVAPLAARLRDRGDRLRWGGYGIATAPVAAGGFLTLREVIGILAA